MNNQMFDFQRDATRACLERLGQARQNWQKGERSSFALEGITGAGKAVIATAVIESFLYGSADLGTAPDPRACFLWVTHEPTLNNQTRDKMLAVSDRLYFNLYTVDKNFMDTILPPGRVYFLNIQKLRANARLGRRSVDGSMWGILARTISDEKTDLYLVLDEAHRGMKTPGGHKTIVKHLIGGQPGLSPPAPVVWGISATINRFTEAVDDLNDRNKLPPVKLDRVRVRESGLIKEKIDIHMREGLETSPFSLLRQAVRATLDFDKRWADYAKDENQPEVVPLLVVQVTDNVSDSHLGEMVSVIESEWPGLGLGAIAHVFGQQEKVVLPSGAVLWTQPDSIERETHIRVVLAKEVISTGWDCPRAEVIYSERPIRDVAQIAQMGGHVVRQPLAQRISTDNALNSATCFLHNVAPAARSVIKSELSGGQLDTFGPSVNLV